MYDKLFSKRAKILKSHFDVGYPVLHKVKQQILLLSLTVIGTTNNANKIPAPNPPIQPVTIETFSNQNTE